MSEAKSICSASPGSQGKLEEWPIALPIIDDIQRAGEPAVRMRRRSHYPEG
ncbi:hypothetical protein ALP14_200195 [Pseudomonas amygdali pv. myricae]|nr:hypothetical protein ALP14_200195 [Pseudomonas amygdali pv. myricae]